MSPFLILLYTISLDKTTGYFRWAVKRLNASPMVVLSWSYLHIILHLASAVLVVGLSKVIR